jgi:AcrR family transcriptional regulator
MSRKSNMPDRNSSTKSPAAKRARSSYHRGNVREDLIRLGRKILESEGLNAITLRRLTREIGVNPTNFYNHFSNMDYLYAAIKVEGHRELLELDRKAVEKCSNKLDAVRALCLEYVFFAIRHPNLYRLMFDDYHNFEKHQGLKEESDKTMAFVVETLYGSDIFDDTDPLSFYTTNPLAITCWSLFHGLSHILIERQVRISLKSRNEVTRFINNSLDDLIHGIGDQLES